MADHRVLVANRGEIAVRIIRAAHTLGWEAAVSRKCDLVHPGYGFLSKRAGFAAAVEEAGLAFVVGASADVISRMGDRACARGTARAAVQVIPGSDEIVDLPDAQRLAEEIGYPVLVEASAGGGGKGIRMVHGPDELAAAVTESKNDARSSFGPAADLDPDTRQAMVEASVRLTREIGYVGAGTVEYLVTADRFCFMEMNTRIQVEHLISEQVTGVDLVAEQLRIATGEELSFDGDARPPTASRSSSGSMRRIRTTGSSRAPAP